MSGPFVGHDAVSKQLRELDWSATPLGPVGQWPDRLVQVLRLAVPSRTAMMIWWGEQLVQIHNETCARLLGDKHPGALGRPARECWAEVWPELEPFAQRVMHEGAAASSERLFLLVDRHGYLEETYWTLSFSPVLADEAPDPRRVLGVLVVATDVTSTVVGERRLETVRQLGTLSVSRASGLEETCKAAVRILGANRHAVPFATMHIVGEDGRSARLAAGYGITPGASLNPAPSFPLAAAPQLANAITSRSRILVTGLRDGPNRALLDPGPLGDLRPDAAMLVPLSVGDAPHPIAVATLGVNPYRAVDDVYLAFFQLVDRQLGVAVADAVALEKQRHLALLREEALTEAEDRVGNLHRALSSNRRIGVAIGILMVQEGLTEEQAFDRLREVSQHRNRKLRDVADDVVFTGQLESV